ncbi:hypothetical protein U7252_000047 [Escherichia coli]|nr:hypothetical protein [Escherichia coli]
MNFRIKGITVLFLLLSFLIICKIISFYFPLESDAANSPVVWQEFLEHGFSAFSSWRPTPDNWYFTIYPVSFFIFWLFGSNGIVPLIITTSFFTWLVAACMFCTAMMMTKSKWSYVALLMLTLLSAYTYTNGFVAHPFSHYSTAAFGALSATLVFYAYNYSKPSIYYASALFSLLGSLGDPWYLPTFFLPIIIGIGFISLTEKKNYAPLVLNIAVFVLSFSGVIQKALNLPTEPFKITTIEQMGVNVHHAVMASGGMLNLFFSFADWARMASFIVCATIFIWGIFVCFKEGGVSRLIAVVALFSIAGIYSSYILSYAYTGDVTARFFLNVVTFFAPVVVAATCFKKSKIAAALIGLFILSSAWSYTTITKPVMDHRNDTYDFIKFLNEHNLSFGYSNNAHLSTTVNWLSRKEIQILQIYQDGKNGKINFKRVRSQSFASWHEPKFINKQPARQFISVSPRTCGNMDVCVDAIRKDIGEPDEILTFKVNKILVYNNRINF